MSVGARVGIVAAVVVLCGLAAVVRAADNCGLKGCNFTGQCRKSTGISCNINGTEIMTHIEEESGQSLLPSHSKELSDDREDRPKGLLSITGFTVLCLWYMFSGSTLFLNKYILSYQNGNPTVLGVCQLLMTTICGFIQLNVTCFSPQSSRNICSCSFLLNMLLVGILRFATVVLSLVSLKFVAVSFTETVKSSAPLFTVVISRCILGEVHGLLVNCSLVPVMLGLALCSSNELSFDIRGFGAAVCTNLAECCQNVYSKLLISGDKYKYTPTELQFYTSLSSVLVQLPATYLLVGPTQLQMLGREQVMALALNGFSFHMQSFTAYVLMGYISPVTYSVANTVKRALLIWLSVLIFGNAVSALSGVGTVTVLLGVLCYNRAQQLEAGRRRAAELGPPERVAVLR